MIINERIKNFINKNQHNIRNNLWRDLFMNYWYDDEITETDLNEIIWMLEKINPNINKEQEGFAIFVLMMCVEDAKNAGEEDPIPANRFLKEYVRKYCGYSEPALIEIMEENQEDIGAEISYELDRWGTPSVIIL